MNSYPYDAVIINGREVALEAILDKMVESLSPFEHAAFSFIREWFSASIEFTLKTSGSTGTPKTITVMRQQMETSAQLTCEALQLKKGNTAFICLDANYIAGKMMFVRSFVAGMRIIFINPTSNPFIGLSANTALDFTALVPFQLHEVLRSDEAMWLNIIKNIIVGGAPLPEHTHKLLRDCKSAIYATYGMTETVSHIALQRLNGSSASEYFTPLPGVKVETDRRGCLEITAPYLGKKIVTNDLVDLKDAAHFKWLGRVDNIINTGGIKVIPENIETKIRNVLRQLQVENDFFLAGIPDIALGNKIILLIAGEIIIPVEELNTHLRTALSQHEVPKKIYTGIKMVFTNSGKINRNETLLQAHIIP